ncbi:Uncharacterized protein BCRIVMBC120_02425 [Bacillus wiedmannii]|nr:Uncharacterized protein BCRIVMBC120_02425 [Bacillus wiedmannii]
MGYIEELREVIGSRPLNLSGVAVAVFNEKEQILLQQRRSGIWASSVDSLNLANQRKKPENGKCLKKQGLK